MLGSTGETVMLTRTEDGTYWIGDVAFMSGDTVTAGNGNEYRVSMDEGGWSAMFVPMEMDIGGTGVVAMTIEDSDGYAVGESTLPASGTGDVTVDGASYHVWMADGALTGARFDGAINGDTDMIVGHLDALPTLSADDEDTAASELRTMLTVAGSSFPIGDLLESGAADSAGSNFVAGARAEIEKIRDQSALLVEAFDFDGATRADKNLLESQLDRKWAAADSQIQKIFPGQELVRETDEDDVVEAFDDVLDALSGLDAFEEAVKKGDEGVFDGFLEDSGRTAQEVFDATDSEARVLFGAIGDTRFGAVAKKERANATSKLAHELGDEDGVGSMGAAGAFAYATIDDTVRSHHIQTSGNAYYEGETIAVTGDGTLYTGDIAIEVRFRSEKVSGLVTDLESEDGEPWRYLVGDVDSIVLPDATLKSTASWGVDITRGGTATYARRPGSPGDQTADSTFAGNLLGTGEDAGSQAAGTWSFGREANQAKSSYISGGFGAERTESTTGPSEPETGDGTETETVSLQDRERKVDMDGTTVDVDGRSVKRLLGASLSGGKLTILSALKDANTVVDGETTGVPILQTYEISLGTAFDKAGSAFWTNGATQIALARDEIEALRNRLSGFAQIDEDVTIKGQKQKIWEAVIDVLQGRLFDPSKVKRANADAEGTVMLVQDVFGQTVFQGGGNNSPDGTPDISDGRADFDVEDGKIVSVGENTAWMVQVADPMEDDPAILKRLNVVGTPGTTTHVIHDGDLMTLEVYNQWQDDLAGDGTELDPPDPTAIPSDSDVLARDVKLVNQLVNGVIAELTLGSANYPTRNAAGDGDDVEALSTIDDVLAALESQDAFEDALAKGGALEYLNRLETAGGDPDDASDDAAVAVGDIWGRKSSRVQVYLGTTNYTRFGVWRKQTNNKAANLGYTSLESANGNEDGDGPGAFAYSSLPATEYQSESDSTYPGGGSATFTGETVALQGTTHYTGLISVTASWEAEWDGFEADGTAVTDPTTQTAASYELGQITAVISDLETGDGDPLQYIMSSETQTGDNPATTDAVEASNNQYVTETAMDIRDIIFTDVSITTLADEDKNTLTFSERFDGDVAGDPRVRITTSVGANPITILGGNVIDNAGTVPTDDNGVPVPNETAMLVGTFVGQDVDGPLGVIGRWTLMDADGVTSVLAGVERTVTDGVASEVRRHTVEIAGTDMHKIGSGTAIFGAFGAEVEP